MARADAPPPLGPGLLTMPLHNRCPMFDVERVHLAHRPRPTRARNSSRSAIQKSRLNRSFSVRRLPLQPIRVLRVPPDQPGQPGPPHLRVVRVPLQLAGRPRKPRQPPVGIGDRVPRVLPTLVLQPVLAGSAARTTCSRCPSDRRTRRSSPAPPAPPAPTRRTNVDVTAPPLVLVEQDHEQRRAVRRTVVGRVRLLLEARPLSPYRISCRILPGSSSRKSSSGCPATAARIRSVVGGQFWRERQRLQAGEDAVPAEQGHEPRQTGGRQPVRAGQRRVAQRGQIGQAAPVRFRLMARCRQTSCGRPVSHSCQILAACRRSLRFPCATAGWPAGPAHPRPAARSPTCRAVVPLVVGPIRRSNVSPAAGRPAAG